MAKPEWQNQSYAKSAGSSGPSTMHSKIAGNSISSMHSKIAKPTVKNYADGGMVKKFADGGSVDDATYNSEQYQADKKAGLEASKDEKVGLWDRLKAGNIDDPSSEAYRRFGAGRGMAERMKSAPDESAAETNRLAAANAAAAPSTDNESAAETARLARQEAAASASDSASASTPKSFKQAFRDAADGSNFEWNGKQYKKEYAKPSAPAPRPVAAPAPAASGKTFAEDVAERKKLNIARNENYGNEGRRPVIASKPSGRGVIDTTNIDPVTLLPRRK